MMTRQLLEIIRNGTLEELQDYVHDNPFCLKRTDGTKRLPIHFLLADEGDADDEDPDDGYGLDVVTSQWDDQRMMKVQFLVNNYPESLALKDIHGRLPLHVAAGLMAENEHYQQVLSFLFEKFSAALQIRDAKQRTPLDYAMEKEHFEYATFFIENYQGSLEDVTQMPSTITPTMTVEPFFHRALGEWDAPDDIIRLLLQKLPNCAEINDQSGYLPLHRILQTRREAAVVKAVLNAYSQAIQIPNPHGLLPLSRELIARESRLDVVQFMVDLYPQALDTPTESYGWLPIHYAVCNEEISVEILDYLLQVSPNCLSQLFPDGNSVLHVGLANECSFETAEWLLQHCKRLAQISNKCMSYPLHTAAFYSCPLRLLELLVETFPGALQLPDENGHLPLHCALLCKYSQSDDSTEVTLPTSEESIQLILDAFPEAAQHPTPSSGSLPLHLACATLQTAEIIEMLVEKYPLGQYACDRYGRLPFHITCRVGNTIAIDYWIKRMHLTSLPPTENGTHPLFLACENDQDRDVIWKLLLCSQDLFSDDGWRNDFH